MEIVGLGTRGLGRQCYDTHPGLPAGNYSSVAIPKTFLVGDPETTINGAALAYHTDMARIAQLAAQALDAERNVTDALEEIAAVAAGHVP